MIYSQVKFDNAQVPLGDAAQGDTLRGTNPS